MRYVDFQPFDGSDEEYFAAPALGSTGLKAYLDPKPPPQNLDLGTAWHWLTFQRDTRRDLVVAIPDFGSLRSKKNRKLRDAWVADAQAHGQLPLPKDDFDAAHRMAESALALPEAKSVIEHPLVRLEQAQMFRAAEFPATELRRKPDAEVPGWIQLDGKTTKELDPESYYKAIVRLFYHLQGALYLDSGVAFHRDAYALGFWHLVVSSTPDRNGDHQAVVMQLHDEMVKEGRRLVEAALLLAEAERISGMTTKYLFNARPLRTRAPLPWEKRQTDDLLRHARETYKQCTNT